MTEKSNWITKNVILLGLVSFFADLSGEMMTPVLPLFIVALGGTEAIVGFIGGFGDFVASILKVFSGYISDKIGRRKDLILIGYSIPFFAKLGIGLSNAWEQVAILKPTERLGKGIRGAPRDSLLADSSSSEYRGKVFGFHRTMDTAGAVLGSFVAIIIVFILFDTNSQLDILKLILIISAIVSLLAVIPILLLERKPPKTSEKPSYNLIKDLKKLPVDYYKFLLVSVFFSLANFTILLYVLASKNIVTDQNSIEALIVPIGIFVWYSVFYTILSYPLGSISDKIGRKKIFSLGLVLYICTNIFFILTNDILILLVTFAFYGAFSAATDGIQKAYTIDLIPANLKGTGVGLLMTITGIIGIISGVIAGVLMTVDPSFPFLYGILMAIIALILLYVLTISESETEFLKSS